MHSRSKAPRHIFLFLIMAVWILIPEDGECERETRAHSAFLAAAVAFFVFERLDKTQLAVISRAGAFVAWRHGGYPPDHHPVYVCRGLNTDLNRGVFNRFRALPIPRWAPLAGRILADAVKQALDIALLLAVGYLLGFRLATSVVQRSVTSSMARRISSVPSC